MITKLENWRTLCIYTTLYCYRPTSPLSQHWFKQKLLYSNFRIFKKYPKIVKKVKLHIKGSKIAKHFAVNYRKIGEICWPSRVSCCHEQTSRDLCFPFPLIVFSSIPFFFVHYSFIFSFFFTDLRWMLPFFPFFFSCLFLLFFSFFL